ncbi:MAG: response regulator [Terracidiphilus sp.]|jgi:CheY-like chemotaxis protein
MSTKVLFVDDEPAILDGYRRLVGRELNVETAVGGVMGLAVIEEFGPFAVVVSDMRMPQMDGARFLARVREIAPDTVRMALTGYADIDTAMAAVNEGRIFRFMTKPCSKENLLKAIESGLEQHRLITAEKELLEGTLRGCVLVLSEMLSFSNPAAFGRAMRLRRFVEQAAEKLQLKSTWRYEIAAMLSQLGCVTLNLDLVNSAYAGEELSEEDRKKYEGHAAVAGQMLKHIPRMKAIAQMIEQQNAPAPDIEAATAEEKREIELGIQLLRTGLAFDAMLNRGVSATEAFRRVKATIKGVDPSILAVLDDLHLNIPLQTRECSLHELAAGMILHQDLRMSTGLLIAAKGLELSLPWIERLKTYEKRGAISGRLRVQMPMAEMQ